MTEAVKLDPIPSDVLTTTEAEWLANSLSYAVALQMAYLRVLVPPCPKAAFKASKAVSALEDLAKHVYPENEFRHFLDITRDNATRGVKALQDRHRQEDDNER